MRKIKRLSHSGIELWKKNRDEFYLRYCADHRPPRLLQTKAMSIGSGFDAYLKSYLYKGLFGNSNPEFELRTLFDDQVESHNRDWAWENSAYVFSCYKKSGALADLFLLLKSAFKDPEFEFTVENTVHHSSLIGGVPLVGIPDIFFWTEEGGHVILDLKVNGYCSNSPVSPKKGYLMLRDGWTSSEGPPSRNANQCHKLAMPMPYKGINVNGSCELEDIDPIWASQLCKYGWLLGESVGDDLVAGIEQIVAGGPRGEGQKPLIRVATHRGTVSCEFQLRVFEEAWNIWQAIQDEHIFIGILTKEESIARGKLLDRQHKAFEDEDFNKIIKRSY